MVTMKFHRWILQRWIYLLQPLKWWLDAQTILLVVRPPHPGRNSCILRSIMYLKRMYRSILTIPLGERGCPCMITCIRSLNIASTDGLGMLGSLIWRLRDPAWVWFDMHGLKYQCFGSGLFGFGLWWWFFVGAWVFGRKGYSFGVLRRRYRKWNQLFHKHHIHGRIDGWSGRIKCLDNRRCCTCRRRRGQLRLEEPLLGAWRVRHSSRMSCPLQ